ncbi:phytosulfokine receptor 1-like protein [Tanacetum coccineum]
MTFPPQLDLSRNHFTGPIWSEFGSLKKLQVLYLGQNNVSGMIPTSLSGMKSIEKLDLSFNSLTGTIPSSVVRLSSLSEFNVAYNNLKGVNPFGGQFGTFPDSSFEGNLASDKDEDFSIFCMLVIIGFGTGFLLTVIPLLVVPGIKGA